MEKDSVEVGRGEGDQKFTTVAGAFAVDAPDQAGSNIMAKIEKMIELMNVEVLSLHGGLVAEKTAHARALKNNSSLQRTRKKGCVKK